MLKKIIAFLLTVTVTATVAIGGTVAYLQSEDSDVNVMTLGNVKIQQIEQERDESGKLVDFTQAKPAYPAVGPVEWADTDLNVNGAGYKVFTDELKNVVDKIVTVKNTGLSQAYVRTVVAIEAPDYDPANLIHINYNDNGVAISGPVTVTMDGVDYVVFAFTYADPLKAGQTSAPSLMQVFLDSAAGNEDVEKFGDAWEILVQSQAVQTAGFENAQTALDTAFGAMTSEKVVEWFSGVQIPVVVNDAEGLMAALDAGKAVILNNDIVINSAVSIAQVVDINLNGHTLSTSGLELKAGGSVENGIIKSENNTSMVPHLKVSGGDLTMENVTVDISHYLNYAVSGNANCAEFTGVDAANANIVLNNCHIKVTNNTAYTFSYVYAISVNNSSVTMTGGDIQFDCVAGINENWKGVVSGMGVSEVNLYDVDIENGNCIITMGNLTINTNVASMNGIHAEQYSGGIYTINYES